MTYEERKAQVKSYLGKTVRIEIDRPIGYVHRKERYSLTYPINYGFIPGVIGGDGEELDVYLFGVDVPVTEYTAKIIGIVHRRDDVEDKLVAAPEGMKFTEHEIAEAVRFQEKYYDTRSEALFEKSCGAVLYTEKHGEVRYLLIKPRHCGSVGFPKGHVEVGESEKETAVREVWEETSITADIIDGHRWETSYTMPNGKIKTVVYFLGRYGEETPVHNGSFEESEYLVLPYDAALAELTFEETKEVLRAAHSIISK